jgi:hypothetical protein
LQLEAIMELSEVDDKFFQLRDVMAMGNSLSPIISNIYMEHFVNLALGSEQNIHHCGFNTLMTHLWSGVMGLSSYRISSVTLIA